MAIRIKEALGEEYFLKPLPEWELTAHDQESTNVADLATWLHQLRIYELFEVK